MSGIIGGYSNVNQGLLSESRDFIVEDSHRFKVDVKQNNWKKSRFFALLAFTMLNAHSKCPSRSTKLILFTSNRLQLCSTPIAPPLECRFDVEIRCTRWEQSLAKSPIDAHRRNRPIQHHITIMLDYDSDDDEYVILFDLFDSKNGARPWLQYQDEAVFRNKKKPCPLCITHC